MQDRPDIKHDARVVGVTIASDVDSIVLKRVYSSRGINLASLSGVTDRDALIAHLGREKIHASCGREFGAAYYLTEGGIRGPRPYRSGSTALARCQYAMLTTKQYAAVLVVDIDRPGTSGGHPADLAADVRATFTVFVSRGIGPAWIGINPQSGKAQTIWLIDPVYADKGGRSRPGEVTSINRDYDRFIALKVSAGKVDVAKCDLFSGAARRS